MASASISKSEKSYIQTALQASSPLRADGRSLHDYRSIALETGVVPLANGSARLNIGKNAGPERGDGTEVLAAVKLEVENVREGDGIDGGRIVCLVSCLPAAYPHLPSQALDDLSYDMTTIVNQTLSHLSLHPPNLGILLGRKSWLLNLDITVLSDSGNIYDALFMAARSALWDTKVPRTRSVQYKARKPDAVHSGEDDMEIEESSVFDTKHINIATDFELPDYWDEGEPLGNRDEWPICITLNLLPSGGFYVDATSHEEASTSSRFLLLFSLPSRSGAHVQSMRLLGDGELHISTIPVFFAEGEKYARDIFTALEFKLKEEDARRNQKARIKFGMR